MYKKQEFDTSDQILIWLNENKPAKVVSILWEVVRETFWHEYYKWVVIYQTEN